MGRGGVAGWGWLNNSLLGPGRLFKNTAKQRAVERVEEAGKAHQMGKEVIAGWG